MFSLREVMNRRLDKKGSLFELRTNPYTLDPTEFEMLANKILNNPHISNIRFRNLDVSSMKETEKKPQISGKILEQLKRVSKKVGLEALELWVPFTVTNLKQLRPIVLVCTCTILKFGLLNDGNASPTIGARHSMILSEMLQAVKKINPSGGIKTVGFQGTFSHAGFQRFCLEIPRFTKNIKGFSLCSPLHRSHSHSRLFEALKECELEALYLRFTEMTYWQGDTFASALSSGLGSHLKRIFLTVFSTDSNSATTRSNTLSVRAFAKVLDGLSEACPRLESFTIDPFSREVWKRLPKLKTLKHLWISYQCRSNISWELLFTCLPLIYRLESLHVPIPRLMKRKDEYVDLRNCLKRLKSLRNLSFSAFDVNGACAMLDGLELLPSIRRLTFSFPLYGRRSRQKRISISLLRSLKSSGVLELRCPLFELARAFPPLEGFLEREARLISMVSFETSHTQFDQKIANRCRDYLMKTFLACFPQIPLTLLKLVALYVGTTVIYGSFYNAHIYGL